MKTELKIKRSDGSYFFTNLDFCNDPCKIIDIQDRCYIVARKNNDHSYELRYFLYKSKKISFWEYTSKKDLYSAVQKLLDEC